MFILLSSCRAVACSDLWLLQPVDVDSSVGLFPAADLFLEGTKMYTERDRTGAVFPVSVLLPSQTLQRQVVSAECVAPCVVPTLLACGCPICVTQAWGGHLLSLWSSWGCRENNFKKLF